MSEDFVIDIDSEKLATIAPNEGGEFKRLPFGDYRLKVVSVEQKAKEGEKPHVMLKPTFVVLAAHDPKNAAPAVGMTCDGLYAGSAKSPKFMQERLACLIRACKIQLSAGQKLAASHFVGREFDASVVWELSDPKFDEATGGNTKRYVNSRVIGERPVGAPRSPSIDPSRASAESVAWLEKTYGGGDAVADDAPAAAAPWAPAAAQPETIETQTGFKPEEAATDNAIHEYRAFYKLGTPQAEQAKAALIQVGFDPEGPINPARLSESTRAAYLAKFPTSSNGAVPGLAPLGAPVTKPVKGTRAPK